ncbi:MerR family transcriptional regulator (plasmid) [Deinococcus sp. D7000]|nr:MerR family transcriptional regulator [Deinococcus sp. D7000]
MLDIAPDWTGGIDAFVDTANTWLPRLLPLDRAARPKDEVNARLVRHYTTVGLLSLPTREGREARYDRRHLLQLLALRRVMADGLSGKALYSVLSGQDEDGLARLAVEGATLELEAVAASPAPSDALSYLQELKARQNANFIAKGTEQLSKGAGVPVISRIGAALSPSLAIQPLSSAQTAFFNREPLQLNAVAPEPVPTPPAAVPLWRVTPRPGLELTLDAAFKTPKSEAEWERLLTDLRVALATVDRL